MEWENIKQTRGKEAESDLEMIETVLETFPFLPVLSMTMERRRESSKERSKSKSFSRQESPFRQES